MDRLLLLIAVLCAGCGFGFDAPTNNGLTGSWTASLPDATARMALTAGPQNVSGSGTVTYAGTASDHVATYSISTLPDERLHWMLIDGVGTDTPALDFKVRIVPVCAGEPLPEPSRIYAIDLEGTVFVRDGPQPPCSRFFSPG